MGCSQSWLNTSLPHTVGCPNSWVSTLAVDKCSLQNSENVGCIYATQPTISQKALRRHQMQQKNKDSRGFLKLFIYIGVFFMTEFGNSLQTKKSTLNNLAEESLAAVHETQPSSHVFLPHLSIMCNQHPAQVLSITPPPLPFLLRSLYNFFCCLRCLQFFIIFFCKFCSHVCIFLYVIVHCACLRSGSDPSVSLTLLSIKTHRMIRAKGQIEKSDRRL